MTKSPRLRLALAGILIVLVLAGARWYVTSRPGSSQPATPSQSAAAAPESTNASPAGNLSRSLLEQVQGNDAQQPRSAEAGPSASSDDQLEIAFNEVTRLREQTDALKAEIAATARPGSTETTRKAGALREELSALDGKMSSLQTDLRRARDARPQSPVVQWLTGELLMMAGGEPGEVLPWFERAVGTGLQRPGALVSLARMQIASNQFDAGYDSIRKALDITPDDQPAWQIFSRDAYALLRFDEVLARINRTWPQAAPPWASALRQRTQAYRDAWAKEARLREIEAKADNLPRVRLTIEHHAFDRGPDGRALATSTITGRDEIEIELFEDQAPATVANFIDLVERGSYNGTRFHWAEAAGIAAGGDPNTKNTDAADDGSGGPGYVIPDEFERPDTRPHLRGSVSMMEQAPNSAGSQFFIELIPHPPMNGHLTVFGRVIRGQEGVDRITPGRTNLRIGGFGKIIPGDLLVRAEVIRKRPHAYSATKLRPVASR